jgi:hypothetical protein
MVTSVPEKHGASISLGRRNAWITLPTGHSRFLRVLAKKFFPDCVAYII